MFESANNVILKVTKGCNLNCSYCYVKHKEKHKNKFISFEDFKTLVERIISDKKKAESPPKVGIIFHGGEPLMLPTRKMFLMFKYIDRRFNEENIPYYIGMQSNLTLLNEEKATVLSKYDVHIGASFDGLKKGNLGRTSLFKDSDFIERFRMLQNFNIGFGLLTVTTQHNYKQVKKSTEKLAKKIGVGGFKVNFAEDVVGLGNTEVDGEKYFNEVVRKFLEEYIRYGKTNESNIKQYINKYFGSRLVEGRRNRTNCGGTVCGAGINVIEVDPDGNINLCGRYSETSEASYIGNIHERDFLRLNQFKKYIDFAYEKHKILIKHHCDSCFANELCDHGCIAFYYSKYGEYGIRTDLICPFYKTMYKWFMKNERRIVDNLINNGIYEIQTNKAIERVRKDSSLFKYLEKKGLIFEIKTKNKLEIRKK